MGDRGRVARVLVVDDHPIVRRGMVMLLELEPWVEVVFDVSTCADAVREAVVQHCDLIVMDLRLGDSDGIAATSQILAARPAAAVVVLSMISDSDEVARALAAGARGYLLKTSPPDEICQALKLAYGGGLVLGAGLGPALLAARDQPRWPEPFCRLTPGQLELAQHLARGESNARIARSLGIADQTVRNRISALLIKLEVPDRVAAVIASRQANL